MSKDCGHASTHVQEKQEGRTTAIYEICNSCGKIVRINSRSH